jgi:hypothetical protein
MGLATNTATRTFDLPASSTTPVSSAAEDVAYVTKFGDTSIYRINVVTLTVGDEPRE